MTEKLLRHIPTGVIWVSQPAWETRSDFEPYEPPPVAEAAAEVAPPVEKPKKTRAPRPEPVAVPDEALSQEASRGL